MIEKNYRTYRNYIYEILQNHIESDSLDEVSNKITSKLLLEETDVIVKLEALNRLQEIQKKSIDFAIEAQSALEQQNEALAMKNLIFAIEKIIESMGFFK